MCRILFNPNNEQFNRWELETSYIFNGDGTGLCYYDKGIQRTIVNKWPKGTDFNIIWKKVNSLHNNKNITNVAIHFRYGTSGGKGLEQTHPIKMANGMYLMHNGVLPEFEWDPKIVSDTQCAGFWLDNLFNKLKINQLEGIDSKLLECLNNQFERNKLLILQKDKYIIINESLGNWSKDGIWRSWKDYSKYGW